MPYLIRSKNLGAVLGLVSVFMVSSRESARAVAPTVVFNEVHYHPADGSGDGEFIELFNHGPDDVDISRWGLAGGVQLLIPEGTIVPAGGFRLLCSNSAEIESRYGVDPSTIIGEYTGNLSNGGERLELRTSGGYIASLIDYSDSGNWPESPDGLGPSLERLSPQREELDPRAWAASIVIGGTPGEANTVRTVAGTPPVEGERVELLPFGAEWRYFKGTEAPPGNWNESNFNDGDWGLGLAGFGYGDDDDASLADSAHSVPPRAAR